MRAYLSELIEAGVFSPREAEVVEQRFGLNGQAARSREELAAAYHVTPERIRLVESRAVRLLGRHPGRVKDYIC